MSNNVEKECDCWSWNKLDDGSDWFHGVFDTKEEALNDALNYFRNTDLPHIYIGKCEYVPLRTDVDPDRVLEDLDALYCDDSGCDYYIYEDITDEERKWLENKLSNLMAEFHEKIGLKPCWFTVDEIDEIDLNEYKESCYGK